MPAGVSPVLTLQTGSLYASSDDSTFTGTGGPWGFSPFTSQFGGVVSSAGLDGEPFDDVVYAVAAGDEVIFVIAVQNRTQGTAAYDVRVRAAMPPGFVVPSAGLNLSVTDGAGADLAIGGDLFGADGLLIAAPLSAYDPDSGRNIALVTYTLQAGPALPAPYATLLSRADLVHVAAAPGGADLSGTHPASATTTVVTAAPIPIVQAETDPGAVAKGKTIAFDVSVVVPSGTIRDLQVGVVLPGGTASLALADMDSISIIGVGAGLRLGARTIGADGVVRFGTVVNTASGDPASSTITLRVVVRADGTSSGPATLQTVISAAGLDGGRWFANVANTVGVIVPSDPPTLTGTWTAQQATTTMQIYPLGGLSISASDPNQVATLAITLQDPSLAQLGGVDLGNFNPAKSTFVTTGTLSSLQDIARRIVLTPTRPGLARLTVTVVDAAGAVAQVNDTAVTISPSVDTDHLAEHFEPAPGSAFMTATADGNQTLARGENYHGPVDYLRAQYIYDGTQTVAITARTPNVFVKNFVGDAAVALQSGQNVVDAGKGSNFLVSGTGADVFFLDARSNAVTWDTIVGFHPGDIATLFGFHADSSRYVWEERAGAPGYEGRTMRVDLAGNGQVTASITFTGADRAVTDTYAITTGQIGGIDYMTIFSL